jgi:hypothetical protein
MSAEKRRSHESGALAGSTWFAGWLFTIAFVKLGFWKAALGLLLWPYFLGAALRAVQ